MRKGILFLALFAFIACSNSSSEVIDEKEQLKPEQPVDGTLTADGNSAKTYDLIKRSGYNHEAPDSSREHKTEHFQHIQQVHDNQLNKYVFAFFIHAEIDDDRGLTNITDRQRNEIKTDKPCRTKGRDYGVSLEILFADRIPDDSQILPSPPVEGY